MKNLYIDFDGVILDTITVLYEEAKRQEYDINDKEFYEKFNYKCILKDKYVINDSINCIQKLIDSNKFNIGILTHCHSIKEAEDKIKYIRKHFEDITIIICPKSVSKTKIIHTKDAILVDDFSGNLKEWEEEGGIPIKFDVNLKSKNYKVIDRLDTLLNLF